MGKVIDRLPEAWKTKKTADAVMAPSAILLAGAGAAAAILGGLPLLAIAGAGLLAYGCFELVQARHGRPVSGS